MSFGSDTPLWPLAMPPKAWTSGGSFGAKRPSSKTFSRHHQGVDLYAPQGAPVFAMEDGIVVADQGWSGPGTRAVFVESKATGVVIVYGAVAPDSYPSKGTAVKRGQQIAKVGIYGGGSTMLHLETWAPGVRPQRPSWSAGSPRPPQLYDVSEYLEKAKLSPNDGGGGGTGKKDPLIPGGEVTASSDPVGDPLKGDLTYGHPCSVFGDVMTCTPFDSVGWRQSLRRELDSGIPSYNAFNKLVAAGTAKWTAPLTKAYDAMQAGLKTYDSWSGMSWPSDAVDACREAAAAVRVASQTFAKALAAKAPVDAPEHEDTDDVQPQGNAQDGGQSKPAQESKSGAGLLIAAAGLGAFALLR